MHLSLLSAVLVVVAVAGVGYAGSLGVAGADERVVEPLRGLTYSADDIVRIRELVAESPGPRRQARNYLERAEEWLERGIEVVDELVPPPSGEYAYGFAGDPKTGESWPWWGRVDDVCSLDRPGETKSPHTGDVYAIQEQGERYYDPGDGWTDPDTGTTYYFKGVWNAYVVRQLHEAVDDLAIAYLLTGEERAARLGLHILDRLATLRTQRPRCNGVADWPHEIREDYGFLAYMGNNANKRMSLDAIAVDLMGNADHARKPSSGNSSLTVFENIRENYFEVFEPWFIEQQSSLQNHAMATYQSLLAQGILFGEPEQVRIGIDALFAFLDYTINRDGDYYEVSGTYDRLGRNYGGPMIALLANYDPQRYSNADEMPQPGGYPNNLQFGDDRRWYDTAVRKLYEVVAAGREPFYGNSLVDRWVIPGETMDALLRFRATFTRFLNHTTTTEDWQEETARLYWHLPENIRYATRRDDVLIYGASQWLEPANPLDDDKTGQRYELTDSTLMPAKRIAILRGGEDENERALFLRGGIGASHAQDDQMAPLLFGHGMMLTGSYGYRLYGTPDHFGWGTRSASHKMAIVNEDLPVHRPEERHEVYKRVPSAELAAYVPHGPAQLIEMRNPGMWDHLTDDMEDYRRTSWLIDVDEQDYYFLDVFQMVGGEVHDYFWHAPYPETDDVLDHFEIEGADPQRQDGKWVLAALRGENQDASFNYPGQSFGERVRGHDGLIEDIGIEGEHLERGWWNPPPGNGYAMMWDVKTDEVDGPWSASWLLQDDEHRVRMQQVAGRPMQVITGFTPTIDSNRRQYAVVARREADDGGPLVSQFVNVADVGKDAAWPVRSVERLDWPVRSNDALDPVMARVTTRAGYEDLLITARERIDIERDELTFDGKRGFVRRDGEGEVQALMLEAGTAIAAGGYAIRTERAQGSGRVLEVRAEEAADTHELVIDMALPAEDAIAGSSLYFDADPQREAGYGHNDWYAIEQVTQENDRSRLVFRRQNLIQGRLVLDEVDRDANVLRTGFPNELVSDPEMAYFNGRRVVSADQPDAATTITHNGSRHDFHVEDASPFAAGDRLLIHTLQRGDRVHQPTLASLKRLDETRFELTANTDVELVLPTTAYGGACVVGEGPDHLPLEAQVAGGRTTITVPASVLSGGRAVIKRCDPEEEHD